MALKYTFQATYKDGSTYTQNPEDVSVTDPKRSCFYDLKQDQIKTFFLYNDEHTYSVNLEDGHFEIDGVPFFMHEDRSLKNFRLVFWRQHTHSFVVSQKANQEVAHEIVYRMGWQCLGAPKCRCCQKNHSQNLQQILEIN